MNSKNTPKNTLLVGFITAYLSIIPPIMGFAFGDGELKQLIKKNIPITIICIIGLLALPFLAMAIYKLISRYNDRKELKKRKLSDYIIEQQNIVIDIAKNGKSASYVEKTIFFKMGKGDTQYHGGVEVSGTVKFISALNCSAVVNSDKTKLEVVYVDHTSGLNDYPNLIKQHNKFLIYTALLKDTFVQDEEYWDILPKHYCMNCCMEIILPKGKKPKKAEICKLDSEGKEHVFEHIYPILHFQHGRYKIIMQIVDYDYGETLRLKWTT